MATAHVFIATSLDGFIARLDGAIDWLPTPDHTEDYGYASFISEIDTIVMGRNSFEKVLTLGPWFYDRPVIVSRRTMAAAAVPLELRDRVEISNLSPEDLMSRLDTCGAKRVYVDGGQLIQSYLRAGLVVDMTITRVPVLIGQGIPLFGPSESDVSLHHEETRAYATGLVQSRYRVI